MVTRRKVLSGSAAAVLSGATAGSAVAVGAAIGAALPGAAPAVAAAPAAPRVAAASGMPLPGGLVCPVPFLTRAAWGADESLRYTNNGGYWPEEYTPVQALTVHHTGFIGNADPVLFVRDIYVKQTTQGDGSTGGGVGWGDIGYNLLIDDQGVVYEGRYSGDDGVPVFQPGTTQMVGAAHVYGWNVGNLGICLLGYFDGSVPTAAALGSLATVLGYLAAVAGLDPTGAVNYANPDNGNTKAGARAVGGHQDWAATDCPGSSFYPMLPSVRSAAKAAMPTISSPTHTSAPTTSTAPPTSGPPSTSGAPATSGVPSTSGAAPETGGSSTGGSSTGAPTTTAAPSTATSTIPTPTTATSTTATAGTSPPRDRGGDEYVQTARQASPSLYPTTPPPAAAPSGSPSPSAVPSSAAASRVPPRLTGSPGAAVPTDESGTGAWTIAGLAGGVAVAGALGLTGWLWRRRRDLAGTGPAAPTEPAGRHALTIVEEPIVADLPQPSVDAATDEMAADEMATDEMAADEMATDEMATDEVAADEVAADEMATDETATNEVATPSADETATPSAGEPAP